MDNKVTLPNSASTQKGLPGNFWTAGGGQWESSTASLGPDWPTDWLKAVLCPCRLALRISV